MPHDFKVGDKVVCVDPEGPLKTDVIYTVERLTDACLWPRGPSGSFNYGWWKERFRLVAASADTHAADHAAGMVPLAPVHKAIVERPVSVTWPASAFPATAFKRRDPNAL